VAIKNNTGDEGAVIVKLKAGGPRFYGKWRDPHNRSKQVEVPIGPAWIVPADANGARPNGQTIGRIVDPDTGEVRPRWCDRAGSPPARSFTVRAANRQLPQAYADWLSKAAERTAEDSAAPSASPTFSEAAAAWLEEREVVAGWKPTTARNMRRYLRHPGDEPDVRGTKPKARLMTAFGETDIAEIAASDVRKFLRQLDREPDLSARSVNAYRAILSQVLAHAVERGWCERNVVADVPKRREDDVAELLVYTKDQVEAIACEAADPTVAALIRVAAGTGLRRGELLELRWRDVGFSRRSIRVERSYAAGFANDPGRAVSTPKGRRGRTVPLADHVAEALLTLREREHFTGPNDLVFCSPTGDHLDPWTTRSRYAAARDAAMTKDDNMHRLTFHGLRHSFCSHLAAGGVDVVTIQKWAGHRDLKTTQRYMHHAERPDDAERLTRALNR
jgi:integrase